MVFEASLLDIPMLFYAFDLFDYISKRDFYYDFESFVPGKIVFSQRELTDAIVAGDFESEKVPPFKTKFFDHLGIFFAVNWKKRWYKTWVLHGKTSTE